MSTQIESEFYEDDLDEDDDEPYTDEEEIASTAKKESEPKATGEVCEEKPLSVKEQIKNFANLKIQELLGPQVVSANQETSLDRDEQKSLDETKDENYENEEYEYSVASESDQYSHPLDSHESLRETPDLSEQTHELNQEPKTPINKTMNFEINEEFEKTSKNGYDMIPRIIPVQQPSTNEMNSKQPLVNVLQEAVSSQVPQMSPSVIVNLQSEAKNHSLIDENIINQKNNDEVMKNCTFDKIKPVYNNNSSRQPTQSHQVQQYRPPEPAVDPLLKHSQNHPQRVWKSGFGGTVQMITGIKTSNNPSSPIVYLGDEIMNRHNCGSVNIALRRQTSDRQWGFTLYGGTEAGCAPFINHITINSIAFQMGLEIGDMVMLICGVPTQGKNLSSLKAEILRAGNELDFMIIKQGVDTTKLLQRAPQLVPQLLRSQQSRATTKNRAMNMFRTHESTGSYEEPDVGIVSGQGIRPIQTKSLRILEKQLAEGVSPGSAVQTKQHFSGARGLASMGEKSSYMNAYGQASNQGYLGRGPNEHENEARACLPKQIQPIIVNANNSSKPEVNYINQSNYLPHYNQSYSQNLYQNPSSNYSYTSGREPYHVRPQNQYQDSYKMHQEPMRTYPAYSAHPQIHHNYIMNQNAPSTQF